MLYQRLPILKGCHSIVVHPPHIIKIITATHKRIERVELPAFTVFYQINGFAFAPHDVTIVYLLLL